MKRQNFIKNFLHLLSACGMIAAFSFAVAMPFLTRLYGEYFEITVTTDVTVFIVITLIPVFWIFHSLLKISISLKSKKGFCNATIQYVRQIKIASILEFLLYGYALIRYFNILPFTILGGIAMVFVFSSLVEVVLIEGKEYYEDSQLSI